MKALKTLALVATLLGLTSVSFAQPKSEVIAVTDVSASYTPGSRPTFVRFLNDGPGAVYVELDGTAVAGAANSTKINACEGREFAVKQGDVTVVSAVADTGQSSTVRVDVGYELALPPANSPQAVDRAGRYINNAGCVLPTAVAVADAELAALAGLTSAANKGIQFTGSGTAAVFDLTAAAKTVLDDASVSAMVDTLGGTAAQGSGAIVRATSPTLVTPTIGAASATTVTASGAITAASFGVASTDAKLIQKKVTLTEAGGAETVLTFVNAAGESFGAEISWRIFGADATPDYAVREGSMKLVCVNKATAVTCTKDATDQTDDESVLIATNSKTLTYAIAVNVGTANTAIVTINIDSDMTTTSANGVFTLKINGPATLS